MKYLVVDGMTNGTGIRDYYNGGYINPISLNLSKALINKITVWLQKYKSEHIQGYKNTEQLTKLDEEGKEIGRLIKLELYDVKIFYFSDATMKSEILE